VKTKRRKKRKEATLFGIRRKEHLSKGKKGFVGEKKGERVGSRA